MNIEQSVASVVAATTTITGIIGSRYYPMLLPENATYPALTWRKISGTDDHNINVGIDRIQFSCWAQTYSAAKNLATKVKARFQRMKDDLVGGSSGLKIIQGVFLGDIDLYEDVTQTYHIPVDIQFIYVKST